MNEQTLGYIVVEQGDTTRIEDILKNDPAK
jgi:hypothetical protein